MRFTARRSNTGIGEGNLVNMTVAWTDLPGQKNGDSIGMESPVILYAKPGGYFFDSPPEEFASS